MQTEKAVRTGQKVYSALQKLYGAGEIQNFHTGRPIVVLKGPKAQAGPHDWRINEN